MPLEILDFPVEIHEKILSELKGQSLFQASKVCRLWLSICARLVSQRFGKSMPAECVLEAEENSHLSAEETWMNIFHYQYLQKCLINNMLNHKMEFKFELGMTQHLCYCSYGHYIFIGTKMSKLCVYDVLKDFNPKIAVNLECGPIYQLQVASHEKLLIVVTNSNITFWTLPDLSNDYKMIQLKVASDNYQQALCTFKNKNISVCGTLLGVTTTSNVLSMFKMKKKKNAIQLTYLAEFKTWQAPIWQTAIWDSEVILLLDTGEVVVWHMALNEWSCVDPILEISYHNPTWIFRGRIFCSTIISSQLLGYWHMDRGASYWLMGTPGSDLIRCRDLGTMFSADTNIEDVLCVCIKQRLLTCGTKEGKILIYYLSDNFFSSKNDEISNENIRKEFDRVPDLTIRAKIRPIRDMSIEFAENVIFIYTWPYLMKSGTAMKGDFQCITLTEGDWVTQTDRDLISGF